jgi:hypothetical protein
MTATRNTSLSQTITAEYQLSDLNRIEGWSDDQKYWIIWKTNRKDKGKY